MGLVATAEPGLVYTNSEGGTQSVISGRADLIPGEAIIRLSRVLKAGADKYGIDNWKLIPGYEHINHALEHLARLNTRRAFTEDHLGHAFCRLAFAIWAQENRMDLICKESD